MRIRKNDNVRVISGNDKGKEGKVLKVFPGSSRIIVEKVNMIKRHTRASKDLPQGGIIEKEGPITPRTSCWSAPIRANRPALARMFCQMAAALE